MAPLSPNVHQTIDDVANALQAAIGVATQLRRQSQTVADDTIDLEAAIGRAVTALRRLQPPPRRRARR
jgi:hypothetical protein